MPRRAFIFGLGFTGKLFADALQAKGFQVSGTTRSGEAVNDIEKFAYGPDAATLSDVAPLDDATHVLLSVPPGADGDPVLHDFGERLAANKNLEWVGYLGTTGVYGDRDGGEVDETSALNPSGERGARRVAAEAGWLKLYQDHGLPLHIFRLAGIYGPGRNALAQAKAGTARRLIKPGHKFSRIHVDDIVKVLLASMEKPNPGTAYNVCDDCPSESAEVALYAAELLALEPPPAIQFADAELSPMALSFYRDNKTVSNARIKQELGVKLRYPSYREGLRALLIDYSAG
jgi:nucleoside-diphosphate-sugar epimerase